MLQEILLSLSGVPSPVWQQLKDGKGTGDGFQAYVSAPEQAMLNTLSKISQTHIEIRELTAGLVSKHPSLVCRAVCSSIAQKHLRAFRARVIEVETSILKGDAAYVGGYHIVPLSTLVADFTPWSRRLEWLQKVVLFIRGSKSKESIGQCNTAAILGYLHNARHTGFSDIEDIAMQLLVVAQSTWMRSVASWVLYGQLPSTGHGDFMVQPGPRSEVTEQYVLEVKLAPKFVTSSAAENMLDIGNALKRLHMPNSTTDAAISQTTATSLLASHLAQLKMLRFPLNAVLFESTMFSINESISQHVLSVLLPRSKIFEICRVLQEYMLLGRGEFAVTLIENADARVSARQRSQSSSRPVRKLGRLDDMVLKESELDTILSKTWADLATFQGLGILEDEVFEAARQYIRLQSAQITVHDDKAPSLATLLPTPTILHVEVAPNSPLEIFLPAASTQQYSRICAYLLSIRRSQSRLSSLWKMTSHRRCHPPPLAPPISATPFGRSICQQRRDREATRGLKMRRYWSSMNKSLFLLNEISSYLHDEVIGNSWKHFEQWLVTDHSNADEISAMNLQSSLLPPSVDRTTDVTSTTQFRDSWRSDPSRYDPRTLARAHSAYLEFLTSALLLNDKQSILTLKSLLELIDHTVALFGRLSTVWEGLDLQEDEGVMDAFANYVQDEKDLLVEMERARTEIEGLLERLVKNIQDIEKAQDSNEVAGTFASLEIGHGTAGEFAPWRARTLNRLLMKLDWLHSTQATEDLMDDHEHG